MAEGFTYEQLLDALSGFHAYDSGCVDSGIHDSALRQRVIAHLDALEADSPTEARLVQSRIMRDLYLTDKAMGDGYGWEDAASFGRWLGDDLRAQRG